MLTLFRQGPKHLVNVKRRALVEWLRRLMIRRFRVRFPQKLKTFSHMIAGCSRKTSQCSSVMNSDPMTCLTLNRLQSVMVGRETSIQTNKIFKHYLNRPKILFSFFCNEPNVDTMSNQKFTISSNVYFCVATFLLSIETLTV